MDRAEAEQLGAMALFGEKYGEWVRVVEVDGVSRELCGGTHVANTAEVGIFKIASEGSSAANVRRIEAITGPAAIDWFREREAQLREAGELLGNPQDPLAAARRAAEQLKRGERRRRAGPARAARRAKPTRWRARPSELAGRRALVVAAVDRACRPTRSSCSTSPTGSSRSSAALGRRPRRRRSAARPAWSRWSPRTPSSAASRPARSSARSRRSSAAAAAAATTWPRPAARTPRSSTRRWRRRGRRSSGSSAEAHAGARPRPRHRPDRLRDLGPERHAGDAAAGDRTAGGARGRRAGRRARGRAGRRRPAAAPERRGGQPGGPGPQLLPPNWRRCSRFRSRPTTSA